MDVAVQPAAGRLDQRPATARPRALREAGSRRGVVVNRVNELA